MLVKENYLIPYQDKDFFILLRIGLWQNVEEQLTNHPDWDYIYKLSCEQSVQGIVYDGLALYRSIYPTIQVPEPIENLFLSQTACIIQANMKLNKLQAYICDILSSAGIQYVVMKGQANARYYAKPLLRGCGDIDFFLNDTNYCLAQDILSGLIHSRGTEYKEMKHSCFIIDNQKVELHARDLYGLGKVHLFNVMKDEMLESKKFRYYDCEGTLVPLAPYDFDVVYVFLHFIKHYYTTGISLRQICDWALALHSKDFQSAEPNIIDYIYEFKFQKQWSLFLDFAISFLGLTLQSSRNEIKPRISKIWYECKLKGNFGQKIKGLKSNEKESFFQTSKSFFQEANQHLYEQLSLGLTIALKNYFDSCVNFVRITYHKLKFNIIEKKS